MMIDRHALALVVIKDILYIYRNEGTRIDYFGSFQISLILPITKNTKRGFKYFLFIAFADELANKATNRPNNSLLTETKNKMTSDMYIT